MRVLELSRAVWVYMCGLLEALLRHLGVIWHFGPSCRVELSWGRRGPILNRLGTLMEHLGPVRAARLGRLGALSDRLELHLGAP